MLGGSPYVAGSRVPVRRLWAFYRDGTRIENILKRFPQLGPAKIFDALAFALDNPEVLQADIDREHDFLARAGQAAPRSVSQAQQVALPFEVGSGGTGSSR